ncbi:MAG: hypothetical protein GXO44_00730, partial [Deferribacteres bacterium]|nr:hypothetical protein [Deferribacteres bacterium]
MGKFSLSELLREASIVNTASDLKSFLKSLSSALKAEKVVLEVGDKRFTASSAKRVKGEPDYQCEFNVNGVKCSFSVYASSISDLKSLEEVSRLVVMVSSKVYFAAEAKRLKKKFIQSDVLWEPFVSSTRLERLIRLLPGYIARFLEVDGVAITITTGEGINLKGFWSKTGDTEEKLLKTHKRLCVTIEGFGSGVLGHLDVYSRKAIDERDPLIDFVSHKLSACFAVFLDREKLEEKLEYFHLFFRIGNLFRRTSQFRKRVELALWALCSEGEGFGFREAAYF